MAVVDAKVAAVPAVKEADSASAAMPKAAAMVEPAFGRKRFIPLSNSPEDVERARLAAVDFLLQAQGMLHDDAQARGLCDRKLPALPATALAAAPSVPQSDVQAGLSGKQDAVGDFFEATSSVAAVPVPLCSLCWSARQCQGPNLLCRCCETQGRGQAARIRRSSMRVGKEVNQMMDDAKSSEAGRYFLASACGQVPHQAQVAQRARLAADCKHLFG